MDITQIFAYGTGAALSETELSDAFTAAKAGDNESFTRLARHYIKPLQAALRPWHRADVDEARQLALVALWDAIRKADTLDRLDKSVAAAVRDAVNDGMGATIRPVTIPKKTLYRYRKCLRENGGNVKAAKADARNHDLDPDTFAAVAEAMGDAVDIDDLRNLDLRAHRDPARVSDAEARTLEVALAALTGRQRDIILIAYGFQDFGEPQVDAEIARRVGVSRRTVVSERHKALEVMRDAVSWARVA